MSSVAKESEEAGDNQMKKTPPQRNEKLKKLKEATIQDKMHSNTMKNMVLIQKQIQANTNITRNRLAVAQTTSTSQAIAQLASVRSQTVHNSSRKQSEMVKVSFSILWLTFINYFTPVYTMNKSSSFKCVRFAEDIFSLKFMF